ncbi:MAG: hypothetical protein H6819_07740 [Phycisphaerales bacterium]|nr:hypothetical protein [Phycisphaerales bacterium]MCB9854333.1 hypothetical protein [Phycisphaerales bacterium]MCB9863534.1 hypothetical protein [Phycisphaerales bacterium]
MLSNHAASDRATRMAIATGNAVNLHIIQATQRAEGFDACFGRAVADCGQTDCAYHQTCMALVAFDPDAMHAIETNVTATKRMPARTLIHSDLSRPQRLQPAATFGLEPIGQCDADGTR